MKKQWAVEKKEASLKAGSNETGMDQIPLDRPRWTSFTRGRGERQEQR